MTTAFFSADTAAGRIHPIVTAAPRELRAESATITAAEFVDRYCTTGGPIRLGGWSVAKRHTVSAEYSATLAFGEQIRTVRATASGPVAAMTSALCLPRTCSPWMVDHDRGDGPIPLRGRNDRR